jgi:hypothetical protein
MLESQMKESEMNAVLSPDPEYLHRILENHSSVLDPETGIHIEENTLSLLERSEW